MIQTVKDTIEGGYVVILTSGSVLYVPNDPANSDYQKVQDWIALGNTPDPADPPPPPPTDDEIYNQVIQNQKVLKAVVLSINDGTLVPGANVSNAALKAIVKANM